MPVEVPVFFNGAANDDKLVYAESWTSITPPSGDKFGFDDVVIRGKGFNVKDPYSLRFTYQQVSLTADPVFPSSPSRIDFKTPNWASRSGMGGAGALTEVTLLHGEVMVFSQSLEISYEFLES